MYDDQPIAVCSYDRDDVKGSLDLILAGWTTNSHNGNHSYTKTINQRRWISVSVDYTGYVTIIARIGDYHHFGNSYGKYAVDHLENNLDKILQRLEDSPELDYDGNPIV